MNIRRNSLRQSSRAAILGLCRKSTLRGDQREYDAFATISYLP
jgi:hypothetical protein